MSRSGLRASLAFLFLATAGAVASAEAPAADIAALIDRLTEVADWDYIGGSPTDGRSFQPLERRYCLADGEPFRQPPDPPDPIRALVRQGAAAVPFLVAHLDDRRATKAAVPGNIGFDDRCDFNARTAKEDPNLPVSVGPGLSVRRPGRQHVVTVGDLCFAALGPIVNRRFSVTVPMPGAWAPLTSPTESPALRAAVTKEWAGLTPERHRDSLIDDFLRPDSDWRRIGACEALACYYPDALEPLALKFLAQPTYNPAEVGRFVHDELYAAAGTRERRAAFDAYVARRGEAYRDGVLLRLYDDLQRLEQHEQHSAPLTEFAEQPRQCLIELYGRGKDVRSADRPQLDTLSEYDVAELIEFGLTYDQSPKIDAAVRGLLTSDDDDDTLAAACMKRLVGRGFDEDIARYCCRRMPLAADPRVKEGLQWALDRMGWTRLHVAVDRHDGEEVQRLLAGKADVNAAAKDGRTTLHLAAESGDADLVRALIDANADLNVRDAAGRTPVQRAVREDCEDVVLLLAERGCDLPDVLSAADAGRTEVVEALLKKDPKQIAARNGRGATALHLAAGLGHVKTAAALLAAGAGVNARDEGGWTPLHYAALGDHEEAARLLLEHGADPNVLSGSDQICPLHYAILSDKAALAALLIEHKADPNLENVSEYGLPLHLAVEKGLPDMVALLLKRGAAADRKDSEGSTALHLAAKSGRVDLAQILLARGADANAKGPQDRRPLHEAAEAGRPEVVKLLIDHHADVAARDATGQTPLHCAAAGCAQLLADAMMGGEPDEQTAVVRAALYADVVNQLAARGADVNEADENGETPLRVVLGEPGGTDVVRVLLEHGANPEIAARTGGALPIHCAAAWGDRRAVRMLLDRGAAVDARDGDGKTPLHGAADAAVVEELLAGGADVNAQDNNGFTPLHDAVAAGNVAVVRALLEHRADPTLRNAQGEAPIDLLPTATGAADQAAQVKCFLERYTPKG